MWARDAHYNYDLRNLQLQARFDSAAGEGVTNAYDGFGRLDWRYVPARLPAKTVLK